MEKRRIPCILVLITLFFICLYTALAQFSVGLTLLVISYNLSGSAQLNNTVYVNGSNVTIQIPLLYGGAGINNITLEKPSGWYNGSQWYIDEISQIKNITSNGTYLSWEANLSCTIPVMIFQVPPPYITSESVYQSIPFYEKNITISSNNHLINISVNVSINSSYDTYVLYWFNSGYWDNYTDTYHLSISNNTALFYGFSTSDLYFRIQGYCVPNWVCSDWSGCVSGTQTRSCTDTKNCSTSLGMPSTSQSCLIGIIGSTGGGGGGGGALRKENVTKAFELSPKILRLKLKEHEIAQRLITIENTGTIKQKFRISSNNEFISIIENTAVINASTVDTVKISISAENLKPGSYSGKIYVSNGEAEKEILIMLEVESQRKIVETHLDISPEYSLVKPGEIVIGTVTLYNLYTQSVDVFLNYYLKDLANNIVFHEEEEVHLGYQLSFEKKFQLPSVLPDESYVLSVEAAVENLTSVSGSLLRIEHEVKVPIIEKPLYIGTPENNLLYLIILVVIVVLILFVFEVVRFSHPKSQYAEAESIKLKEKEFELKKLKERTMQEKLRMKSEQEKRVSVMREQGTLERRKLMRELFHALGLYKTKDEFELKKLQKEWEAKLELKKLDERRKAWLTKQKELEFQKVQKEENVEKLRLQHQQQEQLLIEKRNTVIVPKQEQPGWESKSRLYKLINKTPEIDPKAMNIPLRQTTLVLDLINTLVDKAHQDIQQNNLENAYRNYLEVKKLYKRLPAEHKRQVVAKCIELHDILVEKFS